MRIAIYVRRKRRDYSLALLRRLREMGHVAFRVTPEARRGLSGRTPYDVNTADRIFNWGCSQIPDWSRPDVGGQWINPPSTVNTMAHKRRMFQAFTDWGVPCVSWTTDADEAYGWTATDRVVVRHVLQGHSGEGIEVYDDSTRERMPLNAPLYTKLLRGTYKREFRVLFMHGVPILWMRKRRVNGFDGDPLIRTHANGWVYCVNDVWRDGENEESIHNYVTTILSILNSNRVDFGALDFIGDVQSGRVRVLEVNTAPGLASKSSMRAVSEAICYHDSARGNG